jgi:Micrococcal nuclease (thermonuclease) homologs
MQLDIFIPAILVSTDPDATTSQSFPAVNVVNLKNLYEFIKDHEARSVLDSGVRERLVYEILKGVNAIEKETNVKKWLLKPALSIGLLGSILIIYFFWVFSGGNPYGKWVLVTEVVDGDTMHVGRGWRKTTVQFLGVDTPETVHPDKPVEFFGPEASEFTRKTLKGKKVRLELEPLNRADNYGRLLAYVYLSDGMLFNAELIKRGYARVIAPFHFRYYDEFRNYEREAVASGKGIWTKKVKNVQFPSEKGGKIIGSKKSKIYHLPGQAYYEKVKEENRVYFDSEEEAIRAGYRKAKG